MLPPYRPPELELAEKAAESGDYDTALAHCHRVLQKIPGHVGAIQIMAGIDILHGRKEAGEQKLRAILTAEPEHPEALSNLGVLMEGYGRLDEAEVYYRRSIAAKPDFPDPWLNLGAMFHNLRRRDEAEEAYRRAMALQPHNLKAMGLLGTLYLDAKKFDKAIALFKRALEESPQDWFNLGTLISAYQQSGQREKIPPLISRLMSLEFKGSSLYGAYNAAKSMCLWDETEAMLQEIKEEIAAERAMDVNLFSCILMLLGEGNIGNETLFDIHKHVGRRVQRNVEGRVFNTYPAQRDLGKLRIGMISPDFRAHVVSFFIRGPVNFLDQDRFELYCYSNTVHEDPVTEEYKATAAGFYDIRQMSDPEVAKLIHSHNIHILVDLAGYTSDGRIGVLAYRPAPLQIAYLGYPYTSGIPTIDYVLVDPWLAGENYGKYSVEKPLRLPQSAFCFGDFIEQKIEQTRAHDRKGWVTFGCLINPYKYNRRCVDAWAEILTNTDHSRLYLNHPGFDSEETRGRLHYEFSKRGVSPERIEMEWRAHESKVHLRWYNEVDIVLDTLPMTGGTSTMEAVWMGVPVITLVGDAHHERISYSVLKNIGLDVDELVSFSDAEYVRKAVALGNDRQRINDWHSLIPEALHTSIVCDPVLFCRHFEHALVSGWNEKFPHYRRPLPVLDRPLEPAPLKVGGVAVVPDDLANPVGFCIREHQGWYDPEYQFAVERLARGPQVIDIGKDFGVYALPIARRLAGHSKVLAITTPGQMYSLLQEGSRENGLELTILKAPRLKITLNEGKEGIWGDVSFVRIGPGAGENEGRLVSDWEKIFAESSPIVLCSIRDDDNYDLSNAMALEKMGYRAYRYAPGLDVLLPLGDNELDALSLNVVLCKPERTVELAAEGLLLLDVPPLENLPHADSGDWQRYLGSLPYFASLGDLAKWVPAKEWADVYGVALNLYAISQDASLAATARASALKMAAHSLDALVLTAPSFLRLVTASRVFAALGMREKAANLAIRYSNLILDGGSIDLDEPFLAPLAIFERQTPGPELGNWLVTAALAAREILRGHSFRFTADQTLELLNGFETNPWCPDDLKHRLRVAQGLLELEKAQR